MFMVIVTLIAILSAILVGHKTYWGIIQAIEYTKYNNLKQTTVVTASTIVGITALIVIVILGLLLN